MSKSFEWSGWGRRSRNPIADVGGGIRTVELHDAFGNLLGLIFNPHYGTKPI